MSQRFITIAIWAFVGVLVGGVSAALSGSAHLWREWGLAGGIFAAGVGATRRLRGKIGIPLVALAGGVAGWLVGFAIQVWQVSAAALVAGSVGGAVLGDRLQNRYSRNESRTDGGGFYRGG